MSWPPLSSISIGPYRELSTSGPDRVSKAEWRAWKGHRRHVRDERPAAPRVPGAGEALPGATLPAALRVREPDAARAVTPGQAAALESRDRHRVEPLRPGGVPAGRARGRAAGVEPPRLGHVPGAGREHRAADPLLPRVRRGRDGRQA